MHGRPKKLLDAAQYKLTHRCRVMWTEWSTDCNEKRSRSAEGCREVEHPHHFLSFSLSHPPLSLHPPVVFFPSKYESDCFIYLFTYLCSCWSGRGEKTLFFNIISCFFLIGHRFIPVKMNIIEYQKKKKFFCFVNYFNDFVVMLHWKWRFNMIH